MPLKLEFLGWQNPGLPAASQFLLRRYAHSGTLDLKRVIVAVPGSRAGRRLLEILVDQADAEKLTLIPPRIVTAGRLPELLYEKKRQFAGEFVQQLAWIKALQRLDKRRLSRVIPVLPEQNDLFAWLPLSEMLAKLHRELAGDSLYFSDVVEQGQQLATFNEADRWEVLAEIQARYLQVLDELQLWDLQTARLFAIKHGECQTTEDIVLIGTVDMNRAQRQILDLVAERVTALVCAPQELAERFDEHGCLLPAAWRDVSLNITTAQIEIVAGPGDQADAVLRALARWNGKYSADDIIVGVPDPRLVPYLEQRFVECGLPVRVGVGIPVAHSSPGRLLAAAAGYLEGGRFGDLAALVRHPAVGKWLETRGESPNWLTGLDQYHEDRLPAELPEPVPEVEAAGGFPRIQAEITTLLTPLLGEKKPLAEWGPAITGLLLQVFGQRQLDTEHESERLIVAACDQIADSLREQSQIDSQLAPHVFGADAMRLVLRAVEGVTLPPRSQGSAIELLGWLELPLDDAPALVVTGLNEGIVPAARNGDLFLPNELRRKLNIEDNDRLYARDAYALSVINGSRPGLQIIAARRTAENEPLSPSRLLFACDPEITAQRVTRFLSSRSAGKQRIRLPGSLQPGQTQAQFLVPRPTPLAGPISSMRVTEFKDYLACPYRYYLRHRLRLRSIDDSAEELGASDFGSLLHGVLNIFGRGALRESSRADEISGHLSGILDELVLEKYGTVPRPAIRLQVENLRLRLKAFAQWQADWSKAGWKIAQSELDVSDARAMLLVDGIPLHLRGRIDRIDIHQRTGDFLIFDYKTGDSADPPDKTHRKRGVWIDLQMPLYRHLIKAADINGKVGLGYIVIPRDLSKVGEHVAPWEAKELAAADEAAADVVRGIRAEKFWPPTTPAPLFSEEFGAICQDSRFGGFEDEEAEAG